jgi:hypothetical protein
MPVGALHLLGLPGKTMRRMVPSKWLLIKLIAAWKTTSRKGGGVAVLLVSEDNGESHVASPLFGVIYSP